jgi:hypothetical protein
MTELIISSDTGFKELKHFNLSGLLFDGLPCPSCGSGAVPEPSTWAMMLIGFAGLAFAGYRRARVRSTVADKA